MIDALLKEHACKGSGDDSEFLDALDKRLDDEASMTSVLKPVGKRRGYGKGLGIAAALTLGGIGVYHFTKDNGFGDQVAMNDSTSVSEQAAKMNTPSAPPAETPVSPPTEPKPVGEELKKESESLASLAAEGDAKPEFHLDAKPADDRPMPAPAPHKPSAPSSSMAKSVAANTAGSVQPPQTGNVPALGRLHRESGMGESFFGDGWGGGGGEAAGAFRGRGPTLHDERNGLRKRRPQAGRHQPEHVGPTHGSRYGSLTDNAFKSPWNDPFSTFSVDVDTASYTNVRRMIQGGQSVPKDAVRIEEMINYFSYSYPQPEGKHPFSANVETASCPWNENHRLVKIGLKGKEVAREKRPAANLVFLLDVSGSMNARGKLPLLVDSMKILLKELNADDSVSIVVYAGNQGLALPPTYVNDKGRKTILKSLQNMRSGGSTNGGSGITLAYKVAKKHFVKGGINRVILGTDGDFNVGVTDNKSLVSMVEREAKSGVFLSVLGFGQGNLNDSMLEGITNKGNGNYAYIDNLREGRKVFLDDMMGNMVTIAKDVKIQIDFNPAKVKSYRLIGYANRMLKTEDFKNKRIDAGEIGAGHTVTALYEVVPGNAAESASVVEDSEYQKKKAVPKPADRELVDSPNMLTVKLAYKQPEATKETESTYFKTRVVDSDKSWKQASDDYKFSSGVALFGMLLRHSEHAGQGDYQLVKKLAEQGRGDDEKGHRTEFSDIVRKVAK